jgi:hypothetical protein
MTFPVRGYAAVSSTRPLGLFSFVRRDPCPDDVVIDILCCGVCPWNDAQDFVQRLNQKEGHAGTACPPRRNGNTQPALERRQRIRLVTMRSTSVASHGSAKASPPAGHTWSARSPRTHGACMTSTAMGGSGCRTATPTTTTQPPPKRIHLGRPLAPGVWCVAAGGTPPPAAGAPHSARNMRPTTAASVSAFASP